MIYDCTIGSSSFVFATNPQNPYRRETADFRRQRVDQEREVGEQSLDSGYWLRSQASFHMGSGITSTEPLSVPAEEARFRFTRSFGVDPWTPGELKLLHDTLVEVYDANSSQHALAVRDDIVVWAAGTGSSMKMVMYMGPNWSDFAITNPFTSSSACKTMTTSGGEVFYGSATEIAKGAVDSTTPSLIYNGLTAQSVLRYVKQRLMVGDGAKLYEITDTAPASPPVAVPTVFYTHPATDWQWTDFAEGPQAIYVAGYTNDTSGIYSIGLTENAGAYDLSTPTQVVDMPRGERVLSMYSYLGTYLVVGTNKGVRVAQIRDGGTLVLGPLLFEVTGLVGYELSSGVRDAVAQGRYVWVSVTGEVDGVESNLWRIDLGQPLDGDLRFAVASDLHGFSNSTLTNSVTVANGTLFFTAAGPGGGLFSERTTRYRNTGWLETGRIRMNTLQPKAWLDATLSRVPDAYFVDSMQVRLLTASEADGPWYSAVTIDSNDSVTTKSETGTITNPSNGPDLYVKLELQSTQSGVEIQLHTPRLTGYQVSSIPAPARSRLVSVPVQCWDWEKDRDGNVAGYAGYAWDRLQALEALESSAAVVSYTDHTTGETGSAYIERVTFTRLTPPFKGEDNAGGVAQVTLRLLA